MFKMESAMIIILLIVQVEVIESAKILAWFPLPLISHQAFFRPITQELVRRGHEVTVVTTDPAFLKGKTPANLTEIDIHDISYSVKKNKTFTLDLYEQITRLTEGVTKLADKLFDTPDIKRLFEESNKFDLLLFEGPPVLTLPLTHLLKVPAIQINSQGPLPGQLEAMGAPQHLFLYPTLIQRRIYDLTTFEKIHELFVIWKLYRLITKFNEMAEIVSKKHFGEDIPPLVELEKNVDLLIVHQYPMWVSNQPVPPNVVFIGGLLVHDNPEKELPKDLKSFLDSSVHGVIYMSFGSRTKFSTIPQETVQCFIKAFSKLPYDVLWKWEEDELPGRTNNIRISKWLPQSDLLHHPNIKVFITHGGIHSINEAHVAGVPLIGIPLATDQWYNVNQFVKCKVGIRLDLDTLDENKLTNAVETVIKDKSYRENLKKLNSVLHDQPMSPLDRAVWWMEHILRHGGANHLRTPAARMSWSDYYEIKLVLVVLGLAMVVSLVLIGVGWFIIRLFIRKNKRRTDAKKGV